PRIHNVFCLFTQLGARFDRSTQHITRGDLRNTIFLHDELSLRPFTRARSAKQNDTHCENPLKCRIFYKSAKRYHHQAFASRKAPDAETVKGEIFLWKGRFAAVLSGDSDFCVGLREAVNDVS